MSRSEKRDDRTARPKSAQDHAKGSGFDTKFFAHIGGEIVVVGGAFFVLWKQIQDLKTKVDPVYTDNTNIAQYLALVEQQHAEAINGQQARIEEQRAIIAELRTRADQHKAELTTLTDHLNRLTASHNKLANAHTTLEQEVHRIRDRPVETKPSPPLLPSPPVQRRVDEPRYYSPRRKSPVHRKREESPPVHRKRQEESPPTQRKRQEESPPVHRKRQEESPQRKNKDEVEQQRSKKTTREDVSGEEEIVPKSKGKKQPSRTLKPDSDDEKPRTKDAKSPSLKELAEKLKNEANVSDDDKDKDE